MSLRLLTSLVGASFIALTSSFLHDIYSHQTAHSHYSTHSNTLLMLANTNTNNHDYSKQSSSLINLQLHTVRQCPSETLASLSEACKTLGIESFDVYGDYQSDSQQSYLRQFESEVASHFGKQDALFCLSGGMAQSIALMINAKTHGNSGNRAFACHPTSHLLLHENDAYSELLDMEAVITGCDKDFDIGNFKQNGCHGMGPMRLLDVRDVLSSDNDNLTSFPDQKSVTSNDISTLILELPHRELGGKLTPWDEVQDMSVLCKDKGVKFHCDGARIFEASAGYGHETLAQTAEPFDSVYISFYKGVGSVSGAMLLGDNSFIAEARVWLRRFGGNLYSVLPYAVSCWYGFRNNCRDDVFLKRRKKLARIIDTLNADEDVRSIVQFDPEVPLTSMVHGYLKAPLDECNEALNKVEESTNIRVLTRLSRVNDDESFGCRFEWSIGTSNVLIDDEDFILGWKAFAGILNDSQ